METRKFVRAAVAKSYKTTLSANDIARLGEQSSRVSRVLTRFWGLAEAQCRDYQVLDETKKTVDAQRYGKKLMF